MIMDPPSCDNKRFKEWEKKDTQILTQLWNSMELNVSSNVMFLKTSKQGSDIVKKIYYNDSNITVIYDLISNILDAKQEEKSLSEY